MANPEPIHSTIQGAMQALQTTHQDVRNSMGASAAFRDKTMFDRAFKDLFGDFECIDRQRTEMFNAAYDFCFAMAFDQPPRWLSLLGTSGAGKTMLVKRIVRFFKRHLAKFQDEERNRKSPVFSAYLREGGMLEWFKCVDAMIESRDFGWMRQARQDWLLGLDDIGAEYDRHRELSASKLYDILTSRETRWTVVTANLSVQQIRDKIDARIASRLLRNGSVVVDVDVPDFNLPKHGL